MCAVKVVAAVLVIAVLAGVAIWYFQPPTGTWIVDRQAMHEEGADDLVSRLTDVFVPDAELELETDGRVTVFAGGDKVLSGTWKLEGSVLKFEGCGFEEAQFSRPGRLTIQTMGKTVIFKRR